MKLPLPLFLVVLTAAAVSVPSASAFIVCTKGQSVTLKASDPDELFRDNSQYVLVSPKNYTFSFSATIPKCQQNWTEDVNLLDKWNELGTDIDVMGEEDEDGRKWYEISVNILESEFRWFFLQINTNQQKQQIIGFIMDCKADEVEFTIDNDTAVGQYCAKNPKVGHTGLGVFSVIATVASILGLLIVVDLICFFRNKKDSSCHQENSLSVEEGAAAPRVSGPITPSQVDLQANNVVPVLPAAHSPASPPPHPQSKNNVDVDMSAQLVSNEVLPAGHDATAEDSAKGGAKTSNDKRSAFVRMLAARPNLISQFSHDPLIEDF